MCVDCWNAGMAAPAAIVAGRFAWVGYRDRIPFLRRRGSDPMGPSDGAATSDEAVTSDADGRRSGDPLHASGATRCDEGELTSVP